MDKKSQIKTSFTKTSAEPIESSSKKPFIIGGIVFAIIASGFGIYTKSQKESLPNLEVTPAPATEDSKPKEEPKAVAQANQSVQLPTKEVETPKPVSAVKSTKTESLRKTKKHTKSKKSLSKKRKKSSNKLVKPSKTRKANKLSTKNTRNKKKISSKKKVKPKHIENAANYEKL